MRFLDPLFLWGLLAIGVPVALHLLLRRRLPLLDFPLTRLVRRAEHSRQPRRRLNRVLLLLARASILALLALGLGRMTFGGTSVSSRGPVDAVVVVDDSLSMGADAEDGGTLLERGVEAADSLLAALPDGSRAAVVALSGGDAPVVTLGTPEAARATLSRVRQTLRALHAGAALRASLHALAEGGAAEKRVVVVTDLSRHSLSDLALPRWSTLTSQPAARPQLVLLAPRRKAGANLSVSGLDATPIPGGRLRLAARVAAWGIEKPVEAQLEARTGALGTELRVAGRGPVTAGLGASDERRFEVAAPPEGFGESVAALPRDVLPADDARHAVHHVSHHPRILVVDGDPQNLAIGSETFYVEKALAPGVGLDLEADIIPLSELSAESLAGRAAVLLCNVPELSDERVRALAAAVREGAGLLVSVGNRVDAAVYDGRMAPLLPATLGIVRDGKPAARIVNEPGAGLGELPRVSVRTWFTLTPAQDARVLMRLSDGSPLLVEGRVGAGRVLLLATTLDRDWTDLPISPGFLAFLSEAIARVSPAGTSSVLPPVLAGDPVDLATLGLARGIVTLPDGTETPVVPGEPFTATDQAGAYLVRDEGTARAAFAVVPDAAESDLTRLSPQELAQALSDGVDAGAAVEGTIAEGGGTQAWKGLLVALVCACAAEAWLARRAS